MSRCFEGRRSGTGRLLVWKLPGMRDPVGADTDVLPDENCFFIFLWREYISFGKKIDLFPPLKSGALGGTGGTVCDYRTPLVGHTVRTNTIDIQTVDSDYSKTFHQEM